MTQHSPWREPAGQIQIPVIAEAFKRWRKIRTHGKLNSPDIDWTAKKLRLLSGRRILFRLDQRCVHLQP